MSSDRGAREGSARFVAVSSIVLKVVCGVAAVGSLAAAFSASRLDRRVATCAAPNADPIIRTVVDASGQVREVVIVGKSQWAAAPEIRVAGADSSFPSVAGRFALTNDTIRFVPAYPLVPGQAYRVHLAGAIDTTIVIPRIASNGSRAEVSAVYPTVNVLPMNQLKLYVQFSAPMRSGEAAGHVRLIDEADGHVVPDAFFSPEDERWDAAQTRLTLLFDPGRIKRGLRPNEELGLPLRTGHHYRLVIDAGWRDANGDSLGRAFMKRFTVVAADRTAPRTALWSVTSPRAGTRDTLAVSFGEAMDDALLERLIVVRDSAGAEVAGRGIVATGESRWLFVPSVPWRASAYRLDVGTDLEDLAGNNLRRLFDTDLTDRSAPALEHMDRVLIGVRVELRRAH